MKSKFFSIVITFFSLSLAVPASALSTSDLQPSEDGRFYNVCGISVLVTNTYSLPQYISAQGKKKDHMKFDEELEPIFTTCKITSSRYSDHAMVVSFNNGMIEAWIMDPLQASWTKDRMP